MVPLRRRMRPARSTHSRQLPGGVARELLADVVEGDARLAWRGTSVGLADPPGADVALEAATYVVFDLETTGLRPGSARICEIGAVRVRRARARGAIAEPGRTRACRCRVRSRR